MMMVGFIRRATIFCGAGWHPAADWQPACPYRPRRSPDEGRLPLLLALAQLAEIFRHRIAVALRRGLAAGTADAAIAAGLFHFAAQLHFHLLDIAQRGLNALA